MSENFPKLIGIHGRARSGKDTVANYLYDTYKDHYIEAFADPLRDCVAAAFGIPTIDFSNEMKEVPNPYWCVSPRQILQFVGTELFRNHISGLILAAGNDFWVQRMHGRITGVIDDTCYDSSDTVVIPDVRFQNEYDYIISKGGIIIHLTRQDIPDTVGIPGHASESPINFTTPERTFHCENNSSISHLKQKIANIIASLSY